MKVHINISDSVKLVLIPESDMEKETLKQLSKQSNTIVEIRNPLVAIEKTIPAGSLLIGEMMTEKLHSDSSNEKV